MAKRASVPKFGTWDSASVGYTVYFDKVRESKGGTTPPMQRPYNPNDPQADDPHVTVPPSRPASSHGHGHCSPQWPSPQHRRAGSNSSAASDAGGRGRREQPSKFAPPQPYHPTRPSHHQGRGGYGVQMPPRQQQVAPRAAASPQNNTPGRHRSSAVPKFGVWDEQNAAAAQGFTAQFDNVKRQREVARAAAVPDVPRQPSPGSAVAKPTRDTSFLSKIFGCLYPTVRE